MHPRWIRWNVLVLALALAGCPLRGRKSRVVPPPPNPPAAAAPVPAGPLSITQTSVELPPPQPVDPRALETPPLGSSDLEPEPAAPVKAPRRPQPVPAAGVPQGPPSPPETPAAAPPVEERPRLQEIVSEEEKRRLGEEIATRKREINEILQQASRRNLTEEERGIVERVRSFLHLADQAVGRSEMRQADGLSQRALVMARELRNVR